MVPCDIRPGTWKSGATCVRKMCGRLILATVLLCFTGCSVIVWWLSATKYWIAFDIQGVYFRGILERSEETPADRRLFDFMRIGCKNGNLCENERGIRWSDFRFFRNGKELNLEELSKSRARIITLFEHQLADPYNPVWQESLTFEFEKCDYVKLKRVEWTSEKKVSLPTIFGIEYRGKKIHLPITKKEIIMLFGTRYEEGTCVVL